MKDQIVAKENVRFLALQECEQRLIGAYRRGLEATMSMAKELNKIEREELFIERGCKLFSDYVQTYLQMSWRTAMRITDVAKGVEVLRQAGLRLPVNESQVAELTRLKNETQQIEVWTRLLKAEEMEEMPLTARAVEKAVTVAIEAAAQAEPEERRGVQTSLDMEDEDTTSDGPNGAPKKMTPVGKVEPAPRIKIGEKAEAALERIRRLCGKPVAEAIENGNHPISEKDLIKWSEQEDDMVKRLAHYVSDMRWKVDKAIAFENSDIDSETTLEKLREMAIARGGRMRFELEDIKVLLEQIKVA